MSKSDFEFLTVIGANSCGICSLVGVHWVFPKLVKEAITNWRGFLWARGERRLGNLFLHVFFWTFWKERNRIDFKYGTLAVQILKNSCLQFMELE